MTGAWNPVPWVVGNDPRCPIEAPHGRHDWTHRVDMKVGSREVTILGDPGECPGRLSQEQLDTMPSVACACGRRLYFEPPPAPSATTVHIAIGNTDNRLTQQEWAKFWEETDLAVNAAAKVVHGTYLSSPVAPWQNAAWTFEPFQEAATPAIRASLRDVAKKFRQDSIAWLEGTTDFLPGVTP